MKIQFKVLVSVATGTWLLASGASAQDIGSQRTAPGAKPYSIDVQPLPLVATAGLGGYRAGAIAAVGAEAAVADHIGLYASLGGASVRLSDEQTADARKKNVDPVPKKIDAAGLGLGGRFYKTSATSDSWFGAAGLGATRVLNQWVYGNETVNEGLWVLAPNVEGGYRWVWSKGFLIRLGVGAEAPVYMTRNYDQVSAVSLAGAASPTEDKVRQVENRQAVNPTLDLGLGYAF